MVVRLVLASLFAASPGYTDAISPAAAEAAAKLEELTAEGRPRSGLNFAPPPLRRCCDTVPILRTSLPANWWRRSWIPALRSSSCGC